MPSERKNRSFTEKIKISMAPGFSKTLELKEYGETPSNPRGKVNFIPDFYT